MKSIKVIVIGFILAIALVVWPVEYMQYITAGIGFLLAAVLMAWLGVHRRKSAQKEYEDDVRRYTGTTMMKVVWIEESADERWEHQKDGSDRLRRETVYLPTYEYAVNGRTYQYIPDRGRRPQPNEGAPRTSCPQGLSRKARLPALTP